MRDGKRDLNGYLILYNTALEAFEVVSDKNEVYAVLFPTIEAARYFILGLTYCPPTN